MYELPYFRTTYITKKILSFYIQQPLVSLNKTVTSLLVFTSVNLTAHTLHVRIVASIRMNTFTIKEKRRPVIYRTPSSHQKVPS